MNLSKNLFAFLLMLSFASVLLVSCEKDNLSTKKTTEFRNEGSTGESVNQNEQLQEDDCFTINYPISVIQPDGSSVSVSDDAALEALFDALDEEEDLEFVFPIDITLTESGATQSINNEEELDAVFEECYGDEEGHDCEEDEFEALEDCFTINYPINVTLPDGSTVAVNNDDEVDNLYDQIGEEEDILFVYPIEVTLTEDGSVQSLNSDDEVDALFFECFGDGFDCDEEDYDGMEDCLTVVFPINVTKPDGSTVSVNSEEEIDALYETIGDEEELTIVFPIQVKLESDGSIVDVNSEDEIEELLEACYEEWGDEHGYDCDEEDFEDLEDCLTLVYPITVTKPDGTTATVNSDDDFDALYDEIGEEEELLINYPIQVTLAADNSIVSVASDDEFDTILDSCD